MRRKVDCIEKLVRNDGTEYVSRADIVKETEEFYTNLFASCSPVVDDDLLDGIPVSIPDDSNIFCKADSAHARLITPRNNSTRNLSCKVLAIKEPTSLTSTSIPIQESLTNMDFSQIEISMLSVEHLEVVPSRSLHLLVIEI
ncbi:hypothetical protein PHJA_000503700 [Phtheirospermum japonicum]|uniref:Uncharacterized protein n=1 Tax=Phtheirospermum japonicum TaxID=374723 RepID=A0A830BHH3_9LAMI|nr:hypothetical protein PHJA_000503700 [Phtheirospermum japonicum]